MKSEEHKEKVFYGEKFLEYVFEQTYLKQTLIGLSSVRYLMRAAMAGVIVLFGYVGYILIDANFSTMSLSAGTTMQPLGHFFSGWFFGFCLVFIYYSGAELLTSNMMVFSVSGYYKKTKFVYALKVLILCFLGNLIGGVVVAILLGNSTIMTGNPETVNYMKHVLEIKQGYVTSWDGIYDLFIRAIFCNFFINLAMLTVYSGKIKSDGVKVLMMFGGVFFFMYLGLEHSVANTVFFALAGFTDLFNPLLEIGFNFGEAALNVFIVLIGNFIGGGVLIGLYYAFLNDKDKVLSNEK